LEKKNKQTKRKRREKTKLCYLCRRSLGLESLYGLEGNDRLVNAPFVCRIEFARDGRVSGCVALGKDKRATQVDPVKVVGAKELDAKLATLALFVFDIVGQ
jgi:hypothetical protein